MKVFVTGGSGFIGSAIIKRLAEDGYDVAGLVRRKSRADIVEEAGGRVVFGDLLEPDSWTAELRESDLVISTSQPIRMGEKVSLAEARRRSYYHGQMVGNLFLAGEGSSVKAVVCTYGTNGFGNRGDEWIKEEDDVSPFGYEKTISGAYWHINKTSRKTRVPLINVFTGWVYGPDNWFETLVRGIKHGSYRVVGDGSNFMSLIHIDDLTEAYAKIAEEMPIGDRYCLVDDEPVQQRELCEHIAKIIGARPPKTVEVDAYARLAGDLAAESFSCSARVSNAKIKKYLLPELKHPTFEEGITPEMIESFMFMSREHV